jgi:hypothetical protein
MVQFSMTTGSLVLTVTAATFGSRLCQLPLYVPPALITIGGDGAEELAVEVGPTDCERAGEPQRLPTIAPARRARPFQCGKGSGLLDGPMKAS